MILNFYLDFKFYRFRSLCFFSLLLLFSSFLWCSSCSSLITITSILSNKLIDLNQLLILLLKDNSHVLLNSIKSFEISFTLLVLLQVHHVSEIIDRFTIVFLFLRQHFWFHSDDVFVFGELFVKID